MYMTKYNNKKRLIKNNTDKNKKRLNKNIKNLFKINKKIKKDQYNILFKYYYNNHIIDNYKIYNKFFNKEIVKSRNYYKNLIN